MTDSRDDIPAAGNTGVFHALVREVRTDLREVKETQVMALDLVRQTRETQIEMQGEQRVSAQQLQAHTAADLLALNAIVERLATTERRDSEHDKRIREVENAAADKRLAAVEAEVKSLNRTRTWFVGAMAATASIIVGLWEAFKAATGIGHH